MENDENLNEDKDPESDLRDPTGCRPLFASGFAQLGEGDEVLGTIQTHFIFMVRGKIIMANTGSGKLSIRILSCRMN